MGLVRQKEPEPLWMVKRVASNGLRIRGLNASFRTFGDAAWRGDVPAEAAAHVDLQSTCEDIRCPFSLISQSCV